MCKTKTHPVLILYDEFHGFCSYVNNINVIEVPPNFTNCLQPMDLDYSMQEISCLIYSEQVEEKQYWYSGQKVVKRLLESVSYSTKVIRNLEKLQTVKKAIKIAESRTSRMMKC